MLAASIVIYTLFLTLVFNKRAKPTMSNGSIIYDCDHKIVNVCLLMNHYLSPNQATTLIVELV